MLQILRSVLVAVAIGYAAGEVADPAHELVVKVLQDLNTLTAGKNSSVGVGWEWNLNVLMANIYFSNGTMTNLSSLELVGDKQVVNKTVLEDRTVYDYDVIVGLHELIYYNRYDWSIFLSRGGGRLIVLLPRASVRVKGTATLGKDGTCVAQLPTQTIQDYGIFDMRIAPDKGETTPFVIENIIEIYLNKKYKKGKPYKAKLLHNLLKNVGNSVSQKEFTNIVCKNLII